MASGGIYKVDVAAKFNAPSDTDRFTPEALESLAAKVSERMGIKVTVEPTAEDGSTELTLHGIEVEVTCSSPE